MREFVCPACRTALTRMRGRGEVFWQCEACGGRSSTLSLMRKMVPAYLVNDLWQRVRNYEYPMLRRCSCCPAKMEQVPVQVPSGEMLLDVCSRCHFIWLDAGEIDALPVENYHRHAAAELPEKAREHLATWKLSQLEERGRIESSSDGPDEFWKYIPGLFGLPVEVEAYCDVAGAWITWGTVALIVLTAFLTMNSIDYYAPLYGFIPAEAFRMGGLTFLSSFLLHAGPGHLFGNLYFLIVFGDNVEGVLGKLRFITLLLMATLFGGLMHFLSAPDSTVPCIGASGGISGILTFYALAFPKARLGLFFLWFFRFTWTRVPALVFLAGWILLQVLGASDQVDGIGTVSYMAHLGGAAAGLLMWLVWRFSKGIFIPDTCQTD